MINNWGLGRKPTAGKRPREQRAPSTSGVWVWCLVSPVFTLAALSASGVSAPRWDPQGRVRARLLQGQALGKTLEADTHGWFCRYELHWWKKIFAHRLQITTKKGRIQARAQNCCLARLYISISNKPHSLITRLLIFYRRVTDFEFKFPSFCLYLKNNNNHFPSITNNNTDPQTECWSCNSISGFGCHSLIPRAVLLLFMTSAETLDWIAALYLIRDYVLFCMQYPELKIAPFQRIIGKRQQSLNIYSNWYFLYLF